MSQCVMQEIVNQDSVIGCLLGTAVGDAIGLPFEGISKARQHRMCRELQGHHFLFGKGMISDDTEHACMVAQAILVSNGDPDRFSRSLAWRLRFWLLGLPAGVGLATLQATVNLWLGFPPHRSGVFSAGNGPAMRSPIIGVCYGREIGMLREFVKRSTRITHTDPKAEFGALAVAVAAYCSSIGTESGVSPEGYYQRLCGLLSADGADEFLALIRKTVNSVLAGQSTESFAADLGRGKGVGGYMYHTVPAVIHAWLSHPNDYRTAITQIVRCGGDTDSTAAILGGIIGAGVGRRGIPEDWINGLIEWPRSVRWMERLGRRLSRAINQGTRMSAEPLPVWGVALRNMFFLVVVLAHGFRRLLPPY